MRRVKLNTSKINEKYGNIRTIEECNIEDIVFYKGLQFYKIFTVQKGIIYISRIGAFITIENNTKIIKSYKNLNNKLERYTIYRGVRGGQGYRSLQVIVNNKQINYSVHQLVYHFFIGDIDKGLEIGHIDGSKDNNRVENLEQVSIKHNNHCRRGKHKGIVVQMLDGTVLKFKTIKETAKYFNISVNYIKSFLYSSDKRVNYVKYGFKNIEMVLYIEDIVI